MSYVKVFLYPRFLFSFLCLTVPLLPRVDNDYKVQQIKKEEKCYQISFQIVQQCFWKFRDQLNSFMKICLDKNIKCQICIITLRSTEITFAQYCMCFWISPYVIVLLIPINSQYLCKKSQLQPISLINHWESRPKLVTPLKIQKHILCCAHVISVDLSIMTQVWHLIFLSRFFFHKLSNHYRL